MSAVKEYLTFDDVLLIPQKGIVDSRQDIHLNCRLTKNITLKAPLISANMDSVTEADMAITMARMGGIGILHRFCTIDDQCKMVEEVKRAQNVFISSPYFCNPMNTVKEVLYKLEQYKINSIPVIDIDGVTEPLSYITTGGMDGHFLGVINARNLKQFPEDTLIQHLYNRFRNSFEDPQKLFLKDSHENSAFICNSNTTSHTTPHTLPSTEELKEIMKNYNTSKVYIFYKEYRYTNNTNTNEKCIYNIFKGIITLKDIENTQKFPLMSLDKKGRLLVGGAIGVKDDYLERANRLINAGIDVLVIDIAHGHSDLCINTIKQIKQMIKINSKSVDIIAGNVCTPEGVLDLYSAGADAVKVGVGPSGVCTTRIVTGFGLPQFSALKEIYDTKKSIDIPIIADGGIRTSGDIVKALIYADTVMMGSKLAGTDEAPGKIIYKSGKKCKVYRGMAGSFANLSKQEKLNPDSVKKSNIFEITAEGVDGYVEYKGSVQNILLNLINGIKSGVSYAGKKCIHDIQNQVSWVKVSSSGINESRTHDIIL